MLERIDFPDLTAFSHPAWNDAQSMASAFHAILAANDEASSLAAYLEVTLRRGKRSRRNVLFSGSCNPPLLEGILRDGSVWSQDAALQVLIEICGSFKPEAGQEVYQGMPLDSLIRQASVRLVPLVKSLANEQSIAAKSACELLEIIDHPGNVG